ncbi:MAG: Ig-like domain-containing protein, partial [Gudongella sp.]|nr:Ig-like domain-containing protein [Gudongella sp.]
MNTVKTGSLFAVALVLLCAVCIPSETSDGDGGLSVTISSATFNSYDEMLTIAGTSSETYVNLIITGNGFVSARAQFFVTNDSYSGTISLKGLSAGEYTVTASVSEAVKAEKEFTVPESPNHISVTGVSLSHTALSMTINQSEVLTATVLPSDASDKTVTWSSDKPSVATISNGTITAVSVGEA